MSRTAENDSGGGRDLQMLTQLLPLPCCSAGRCRAKCLIHYITSVLIVSNSRMRNLLPDDSLLVKKEKS